MAGKGGDFLGGAPGCPGWPGTLTAASLQPWAEPHHLPGCAILQLQTQGNSRRVPAPFSEVVGEFFIYIF